MTLSYNWLSEYLPVKVEPRRLSEILTSIGLEVESMKDYESVRGGLKGLVVGEIVECTQHPNADKLKLTRVNTGTPGLLQIVCGAPNAAAGQKVVVAPVGATIFPVNGTPVTMKVANIRGVESHGMICAEDEIGLGPDHDGIVVLPADCVPGTAAAGYFQPFTDIVYEIGLTPNRMDAMSHLGVARDVCAYLSHHDGVPVKAILPFDNPFKHDNTNVNIKVTVENTTACRRYSGVSIQGVTIKKSPKWLADKLQAIGVRPINNIVDITNYVLHETGQPLHAFDADAIKGAQVIVKNLPEGTLFVSLDEKARKLSAEDLMICNIDEPMCIAGVFGGLSSGVKGNTRNIFLESAWFNPSDIRKTSFRHQLRTEAATRFEKGVDISSTVNVLERAALLIKEIAGGEIASAIVDVYPSPKPQTEVSLSFNYLQKLTGKHYPAQTVHTILDSLGFEIVAEEAGKIQVKVPYSKADIHLPADIVEEILRIDGFDNIDIPSAITITPSVEMNARARLREKVSAYLTGLGFSEILTNSIINSAYLPPEKAGQTVRMMNSLSSELNVMRPSMLESGLQVVAYNVNRRNMHLKLFEFGRTYTSSGVGIYEEENHLCLYLSGNRAEDSWKIKSGKTDFYTLKGIAAAILQLTGLPVPEFTAVKESSFEYGLKAVINDATVLTLGMVSQQSLRLFDIRQPVLFADFSWDMIMGAVEVKTTRFAELPKQLPVQRDLSITVAKSLPFNAVEKMVQEIKLAKLKRMQLFDIFESDKLGVDRKSFAVSFTFLDDEKTLTDTEIDSMMKKIMVSLENGLQAEIRK